MAALFIYEYTDYYYLWKAKLKLLLKLEMFSFIFHNREQLLLVIKNNIN